MQHVVTAIYWNSSPSLFSWFGRLRVLCFSVWDLKDNLRNCFSTIAQDLDFFYNYFFFQFPSWPNFFHKISSLWLKTCNFFQTTILHYGSRLRIFFHKNFFTMVQDLEFLSIFFPICLRTWNFFHKNFFTMAQDIEFFFHYDSGLRIFFRKNFFTMAQDLEFFSQTTKSINILYKKPFGLWKSTPLQI